MTILLSLAFGTLVSEDLACLAAGLLIARGEAGAIEAIAACAAGIFTGDLALFWAGRLCGSRALSWKGVSSHISGTTAPRFAAWLETHMAPAMLASRVTPGTRLPLYLAAGACGVSLTRFAAWSAVAVLLWTPLVVLAGASIVSLSSGVAAIGAALCVCRVGGRLCTRRGRQQLAAAAARLWRWEFWPMWIFYAPVAIWTMLLALRHGGFRTLTAANPGIPDGGVVGESKIDILRALPADATIAAVSIEAGSTAERRRQFRTLLDQTAWPFPVVLKPDVGQRGSGVRLVRSREEGEDYVRRMPGRVLMQPYHPGPYEAGVFYYRRPGEAHGRILAMTDKHFPFVTGDGVASLADLVWAHARLRMQARTFLARLGDRALAVPSAGARVSLGMAGNHAQGTMFTDGRWMITPALERRIDTIARHSDGFYIGRFDIRFSDRDAFMAGRDLAIVELNGATAECTNIYDPAGSLFGAYRQLFQQWRLVFEIGAENRRRGREASTPGRLRALIRAHLAATAPFPVSD